MRELWNEVEVFDEDNTSLGKFPSPRLERTNLIRYCVECGRVYGARRPVKQITLLGVVDWHYHGASCRDHPRISRFSKNGGGFLTEIDDDVEVLPRALMLHELEVAAHIWRKEYERNCAS